MKALFQKFRANQDGMTLVDIAIALLVIGILTAPLIQSYNLWRKRATYENNLANFNVTADAIDNFYFIYGRYPCPADPTLGSEDPNYGMEENDNPDSGSGNCTMAAEPSGKVIIGALPFKTLKMKPDEALDSFGNKMVYAVTLDLTKKTTFNNNKGEIHVLEVPKNQHGECSGLAAQDLNLNPTTGTVQPPYFHFLFFSLGANGKGAYNAEGNLVQQCTNVITPGGGGGTNYELENCANDDPVFVNSTCAYEENLASARYFDDQFYGGFASDNQAPSKIWDNGDDINNLGTKNLYIGIGTPSPEYDLDVMGNIRASAQDPSDPNNTAVGNTYAGAYCTEGGKCFSAGSIAGDDPDMSCTSSTALSGIGSSQAKCVDTVAKLKAKKCSSGKYALGFDAAGNIICGVP